MNARIAFLLSLLMLNAVSCGSQTHKMSSIRYDCIEIPTITPDDMPEWPAAVFVFRDGKCVVLNETDAIGNIGTIDGIREGDSVVCVAGKLLPSLGFSRLDAGGDASEYRLGLADSDSEILTAGSIVKEVDGVLSQMLTPLTASVSLELKSASVCAMATLRLPETADTWIIAGNRLEFNGKQSERVVTNGEKVYILPQTDGVTGWRPEIEIKSGGMAFTPHIPKIGKIQAGQSTVFTIDLNNVSGNGSYVVSWKTTEIYGGKKLEEGSMEFVAEPETKGFYKVSVFSGGEWEPVQVYKTLCSDAAKHSLIWNDWGNAKALRDTMSYCIFENDFSAPVKVRVENLRSGVSSVEVRPTEYGIKAAAVSSNVVEFTIPSYEMRKLSVEFGEDRQHNLFIYGARPDRNKPSGSSSKVKYYGPGTYNAGTISLSEGQTLYIDYGAKVYGNVKAVGSGVTIAGNGILSGEKMKHWGDSQYSWGDFLVECRGDSGLTVKDVTFIDSPGWNMIVRSIDHVRIDNINMISWELNGDGIDIVSCKDVEIRDCFIRTYDDCVTLKCRFIVSPITDVSDVRIYGCLIWNDYARGIVVGPESGNINDSGRIHDIRINDCTFLQHKGSGTDDLRAAFAIGQGTDGKTSLWHGSPAPTEISDLTVSDLTFDNIASTGRNISIWQYGGSPKVRMSRISFDGIKVLDKYGNMYPAFNIMTRGSSISELTIKDFTVNGTTVTGCGSQFVIDVPANVGVSFQ